jgi:polar amino acid transport system substrate-binding protein
MPRLLLRAIAIIAALAAMLVTAAVPAQPLVDGTLRAAFIGTNPVQGRVEPSGEVVGPVGALVPALAARLNVDFEIVPVASAAAVIAAVTGGSATIGFLAYEDERATQVDYSAPYALMGNAYLVLASGPLQRSADVDQDGVVVGAVRGQSQQVWVSGNLRRARVRPVDGVPAHPDLVSMLVDGVVHAFAANRQRMTDTASTDARVRLLPDDFSTIPQAMVVRPGAAALLAEVDRFLAAPETKALVRASLDDARLAGVEPAP